MLSLRTPLLWSLALSGSLGFQVHFYGGTACHGAPDGTIQISLGNNRCSTEFMGIAQSAIIELEDSDSLNDSVFFSGADNCDITNVVAAANSGCIDFASSVGEARSFEVISGQAGGARRVKSRRQALTKADPSESESQAGDETSVQPRSIYHGMQFEWNGQQYRYHQLFNETFSGVLLEEWDDNVHVANDEPLPEYDEAESDSWRDADSTPNMQRRVLNDLEARAFRQDICRVVEQCGQILYRTPGGLKKVGAYGIDRAAAAWRSNSRKTFWQFLNTPFVSEAITVGGSGWYVSLATQGSSSPATCSTTGVTQTTLKEALAVVLAGGDVDALEMSITVGGRAYTVNIEAVPTNLHKPGECGAVSPNP